MQQRQKSINERFDMPEHLADLLIHFLEQNGGKLSMPAKEKEFKALSDQECQQLEKLYEEIFQERNIARYPPQSKI
ncbi:MAG: hypothetical protein F9K49_03290 [Caedimonadaceae bacterium]|nr:MAG: hypothetical protein F9K49_03290 [Caedimonadaceae bacterium]